MILRALAPVMAMTLAAESAASDATPEGRWTSPSGSITIEIAPCPATSARYCGTVVKASAKAVSDTRKASGTDLVGSMLVRDMRLVRPGHWRGTIIIPDRGQKVSGAIRIAGDKLEVKGCTAGGIICKAQRWGRAR